MPLKHPLLHGRRWDALQGSHGPTVGGAQFDARFDGVVMALLWRVYLPLICWLDSEIIAQSMLSFSCKIYLVTRTEGRAVP